MSTNREGLVTGDIIGAGGTLGVVAAHGVDLMLRLRPWETRHMHIAVIVRGFPTQFRLIAFESLKAITNHNVLSNVAITQSGI